MHVRQQIREALVGALAGLSVGANVFASRTIPLDEDSLPCLLVNTDDETIEQATVGQLVERRLTVTLRAVVKAVETHDAALDGHIEEVEARLAGNTLGGLVAGLWLDSIAIEYEQIDRTVGIAEMRWTAVYFTNAGAPGTAL